MIRVTRAYRFSASHRLHTDALGEEENYQLYGKCNNPFGHGHNYEVQVSARGPLDPRTGRAVDLGALDALVESEVLRPFDCRDLNTEVEAFRRRVPTSENLVREICRRLKRSWSGAFPKGGPALEKIRIMETRRNIFEVFAHEID
ncbi:MAG: 6-carboxytetrahydropterin synthase [Bryobacteraceae bacterium]